MLAPPNTEDAVARREGGWKAGTARPLRNPRDDVHREREARMVTTPAQVTLQTDGGEGHQIAGGICLEGCVQSNHHLQAAALQGIPMPHLVRVSLGFHDNRESQRRNDRGKKIIK